MILPIVPYGDPLLKKRSIDIEPTHPGLKQLIADMYETMYAAQGVGLAAPQVGHSIRLFIVDGAPFAEEDEEDEGEPDADAKSLVDFKKIFINPEILDESGEKWGFTEGCLSIPNIREEVMREPKILLRYQDENFNEFEETFIGYRARIIQHEYDHLEGILFTDRISAFRRRILQGKLNDIAKGKTDARYRMRYPIKLK
jgi:peptide deformylase